MNSLDVILIVILIAYAISGYVQGFVVNLIATIGLLAAGLIAIIAVPHLLGDGQTGVGTSLTALGIVLLAAAVGQAVGTYVGTGLRGGLTLGPLRRLDALGGAALSLVAVLAASWALGYSVSGSSIPYVANAARDSEILGAVDRVVPQPATDALRSFNRTLDANFFPRYLDPFQDEQIRAVGPPTDQTLQDSDVRRASESVVKVLGVARCDRGIEGSGFFYSPGRVMTNAHVVAGVSSPTVTVDGQRQQASVVLFDPELDIAVLATNPADVPSLAFDPTASSGQQAAVLGFPENGPFDARAARIRSKINLQSPDIYDRGQVTRETYSVRGLVRSGNSGGPLVSTDGDVLGVIFAASTADSSTGYALTAEQVQAGARQGVRSTSAVSTGGCA